MKKYLLIVLIVSTIFSSAYSQWKATKGPYGGDINCFHEYNNTLYAGTGAGLFSSTDNGDSWSFVNIGFPASITDVANMGGRLFAGTEGKGIVCSSDNGVTWQSLNTGLSDYYRFCGDCITGFSVSGSTIYAATGDGLLKLESNQNAWTSVAGGQYTIFSGEGQSMIYSQRIPYGPGVSTKITTDGGMSFRSVSFPGPQSYDRDLAYSLDISGSSIFASTYNEVFFSSDNGYNWTSIYHDSLNKRPIMVKVIDDKIYLATEGNGVLVSSLNSFNWSNTGLPVHTFKTLYKSNNYLFAGASHSKGVFRSNTGTYSWNDKNEGLAGVKVRCIESYKNTVFAGVEGGVMMSKDSGSTWRRIDLRLPSKPLDKDNDFYIEEIASNGKIILAGSSQGTSHDVFISIDSGSTWNHVDQTFENILAGVAIMGDRLIICSWFKMYYSDDRGITWKQGNLPAGNYLWDDLRYDQEKLYLAASNVLYSSSDAGVTWNAIPHPASAILHQINLSDSMLYITSGSDGLYGGNKDGSAWFHSYVNNPNNYSSNYNVGIANKDIFISSYLGLPGLMHSSDQGRTWEQDNFFGNHYVEELGNSREYVFANTPGFGIWKYGNPVVQSIEETDKFTSLIFPNPSTGTFTIRLNKSAKASICVYDVLGNCIEKMQMNGRDQSVDLSGKSKGIYFIEVLVNEQKIVRKVTLN
ncbi:MAG: two component regulator propeller domain protein [Bacteroidetes bacterium]|jgi:photosystem II stability/assembly factor-like uncharacterized protein|nr:two component regulator propeller domain protein [Bacteroidota bacterium]